MWWDTPLASAMGFLTLQFSYCALRHEEILCNFTHQYSRFLLREIVSEANHGRFVPYLVQAVGEEHALYRNDGEETAWPPYTSQIELAVMITFRYSPTASFQITLATMSCFRIGVESTCFATFLHICKCLWLYTTMLPFMASTYVLGQVTL
jgi:hypothetical protein